MTSLAEIKRTITEGTLVQSTHYQWPKRRGEGVELPARRIAKVQSNAFAFEASPVTNGQMSWHTWGKARQYRIHDDGTGFDYYDGETLLSTYRIIKEG